VNPFQVIHDTLRAAAQMRDIKEAGRSLGRLVIEIHLDGVGIFKFWIPTRDMKEALILFGDAWSEFSDYHTGRPSYCEYHEDEFGKWLECGDSLLKVRLGF